MKINSSKGLVGSIIEGNCYSFTKEKTLAQRKIKVIDKINVNTNGINGDVYIGINIDELNNLETANDEPLKGDKKVEEPTSKTTTEKHIIENNASPHTEENPNVWSNETQRFGPGKSESNLQNDLFASKECEDMLVESSEEEESSEEPAEEESEEKEEESSEEETTEEPAEEETTEEPAEEEPKEEPAEEESEEKEEEPAKEEPKEEPKNLDEEEDDF